MNHTQIPEEKAIKIQELLVELIPLIEDSSKASKAIVLAGELAICIDKSKPLPKKPGPQKGSIANER